MEKDHDQALIERIRGGDRDAFEMLVVRYQGPIYNAAYRVLGRAEDAADIAQAVFLRIAERLDDYDPQYKFFSWIYRIAVNESLNLLRRSERNEELDDETDLPGSERDDPERRADDAESSAKIRSALLRLSAGDRMVITLRHFAECSYDEIGDILEIDVKTVKSRLYEARQRLRSMLNDLRPH